MEGHPDTQAWGSKASGTWGIRSPPRGGQGTTEAVGRVQDEAQGEPLKGSWSAESLQPLSSQGCAPCAFTARPPAPTGRHPTARCSGSRPAVKV